MQNTISKALNRIIESLNNNVLINSIYTLQMDELDQFKENGFPLANVQFTGANFAQRKISFEVVVLNQRIKTNDNQGNDILVDNRFENMNLAHSVLNQLITDLGTLSENNIFVDEFQDPVVFYSEFFNGLDGMALIISFDVPNNTKPSICKC